MRVVIASLLLITAASVAAAPPTKYEADLEKFDARIAGELQKLSPGAVPLFLEGNKLRVAGSHAAASEKYAAVVRLAPSFSHALRRQAQSELELGRRDVALKLQRKAVAMEASPENYASLASVLTAIEGNLPAAEAAEALAAAEEVLKSRESDVPTLSQAGGAAMKLDNNDLLERVSVRMVTVADDEPLSHYMRAMALGMRGELGEGKKELVRAKELGLDPAAYDELVAAFDEATPLWQKLAKWTAWIVLPWALGLALLYVAGAILGRAALRASQELPSTHTGEATSFGASLRNIYARVIQLAAAYFYISVPIAAFLTLSVVAGFILALMAAGWLPVKLVIIAVIVGGVSVIGLLRGLFVKYSDEDPGRKLELATHPELRALLDSVAKRIGTRAVDNVYLTPGTDVAVMERNRKGAEPERCLILGVGVIDNFELQSFKAVLGHEYGHFTNRDTAGGDVAFKVSNRLSKAAMHLAEGGAAVWYNPAWLFLTGFNRLFLRVSHGATRFQEAMADRWAAFAYGSENFEKGLRHAIVRSVVFDAHAGLSISDVVENRKPLLDLYALIPANSDVTDVLQEIETQLGRETSADDSHPSFRDRIAWVRALNARGTEAADPEARDVWSLFSNAEAIKLEMTGVVRENLRNNYGVEIGAEAQQGIAVS